MVSGATPRTCMLGGVVGLALMLGRVELEGDAEDSCRIGVESKLPIEVF